MLLGGSESRTRFNMDFPVAAAQQRFLFILGTGGQGGLSDAKTLENSVG